jgi:hypothetical protein
MFGVAVVACRKERLASRFIAISRSSFLPKQTSSSKPAAFCFMPFHSCRFVFTVNISIFFTYLVPNIEKYINKLIL